MTATALGVVAGIPGLASAPDLAHGAEALALAYIGPGAGIAAVGAVLAIGWVGFQVIVGLVWYPVRQVRQWRRARRSRSADPADETVMPHARSESADSAS